MNSMYRRYHIINRCFVRQHHHQQQRYQLRHLNRRKYLSSLSSSLSSPPTFHVCNPISISVSVSSPPDLNNNNLKTGNHTSKQHQCHYYSSSSASPPSSSSSSSSSSTSPPRPPRPPHVNPTLLTLDASPILDPTVYIKKSSKSSHRKCGSEATKRLLKAQSKIRKWIWDTTYYQFKRQKQQQQQQQQQQHQQQKESSETSYNATSTDTSIADTPSTSTNTSNNTNTNTSTSQETSSPSFNFALIGHGVPYQLLQDHVDCGWNILDVYQHQHHNQLYHTPSKPTTRTAFGTGSGEQQWVVSRSSNENNQSSSSNENGGNGNMSEHGDIIECNFHNGNGELKMDWIRIRNREGHFYSTPYPPTNIPNSDTLQHLTHQMDLHLIVMNRLSRSFGTILQSMPFMTLDHNHNTSSTSTSTKVQHRHPLNQITNTNYWKKENPIQIQHWKTTIKRGFVYPPSASFLLVDNDYYNDTRPWENDDTNEDDKEDEEEEYNELDDDLYYDRFIKQVKGYGEWTNPPIVELIPGNIIMEDDDDNNSDNGMSSDDEHDASKENKKIKKREPSYVRITIQGIPSSFWKGNNNDETNQNTSSLSLYDGFTTSNERDDMVPVSLIFEACFQEEVGN